jgi:hypothetical protein
MEADEASTTVGPTHQRFGSSFIDNSSLSYANNSSKMMNLCHSDFLK